MDEQDELTALQALWRDDSAGDTPMLDVSALWRNVRRKQRRVRVMQLLEWSLFLAAVLLIYLSLTRSLDVAKLCFVLSGGCTLLLVQWRYMVLRRIPALDHSQGLDAYALLAQARRQSESELAIARFNLRGGRWLALAGLGFVPWLAWSRAADVWLVVLIAGLWYVPLLINEMIYRRSERSERARLAWLERLAYGQES
ncbi:MAG: hypothetical protein JNN30_11255 [Rhodanobacteraceae bacterium]|nr:hypothetical protein [Rhodanobacteraceae bacterium]